MTFEEVISWLKKHPSCPQEFRDKDWKQWTIIDLGSAAWHCNLEVEFSLNEAKDQSHE